MRQLTRIFLLVAVLPTFACAREPFDTEIAIVYLCIACVSACAWVYHSYSDARRMYTPFAFGRWDTLDAVAASFVVKWF